MGLGGLNPPTVFSTPLPYTLSKTPYWVKLILTPIAMYAPLYAEAASTNGVDTIGYGGFVHYLFILF